MDNLKICIIKLGALGDVVRTTSILPAIKQKYPDSEITWITKPECKEILEGNPLIKRILTLPCVLEEEFDILYNFDLEQEATHLAMQVKAIKKYGYYDEQGFPVAFNSGAEYCLNTIFDDELKKSNKKTHQEMMFEVAELEYKKQKGQIVLTDKDKEYALEYLNANNLQNKKILGLNIGSSKRWPSKAWHIEKVKEFIKNARLRGYEIVLLGGDDEKKSMSDLALELNRQNIKVYETDTKDSLKKFFAIIGICDRIVCADTLALHVALALEKPTTALFFCTSPYEIEDYGLLTKITSSRLLDFFPEKSDQYSEELVNSISVEQVLETIHNKP